MTSTQHGFTVITQLRVLECEKEEPVYEPRRSDLWVMVGLLAVASQFALFYVFGVYKALELFLHRMGL